MMAIGSIQPKVRIPFFDTTKGILIVFLVFHHIVNMAKDKMPVENLEFITQWDILYVPYFMQAFFFITGYCSSFNKSAKDFVWSNVKALLIPLLFFSIVNQLVSWFVDGDNFFYVTVLGTRFFFVVELYWFLSALFIAKLLLFAAVRCSSKSIIQFIVVLIPFICAIALNTKHFHFYNWFHWHNGLVNLMFLWIGYTLKHTEILKEHLKKYGLIAFLLYIIGLIVFNILGKSVPYYTHFPHFNLKQTPFFVYFSITGTFMILYLGEIIQKSRLLLFFGKNSIVVYGIHFSILNIIIFVMYSLYIPVSHIQGLVFYCMVGGATLLISYCCCLLFQKKTFAYLIGKF